MVKKNQNQHYVPQFILRRFCNEDGHLHVYDKWNRQSFVASPSKIASENGFYDISIDDKHITLEPMMCKIEDVALRAINAITDNISLASISSVEKNAVAYFFATQILRTRSSREMLSQMQEGVRKILPKKNLKESQLPAGFFMDKEELKLVSLRNLKIANELAPQLVNKLWLLNQTSPDDTFYISDNPLVRHNDQPQSPHSGNNGLASPGIQIHMPLSSSLTLSFICETLVTPFCEHKDSKMRADDFLPILDAIDSGRPLQIEQANVEYFNSLQITRANRFIFASNDDFSLVEDMLNSNPEIAKPRQIEVQ